MELICGVPKPPKNIKYDNWGTWGRMGISSSNNSLFSSRSSTLPHGGVKSSSHLRQHIIPTPEVSKRRFFNDQESYNTLFDIPQTTTEYFGNTKASSLQSIPFRRTKTLPVSSIKRSGTNKGVSVKNRPEKSCIDDEELEEPPSLRSLKDKFKLESFRRYSKSKINSNENSKIYTDLSQNIYAIPKGINTDSKFSGSIKVYKNSQQLPFVNIKDVVASERAIGIPSTISIESNLNQIMEEKEISPEKPEEAKPIYNQYQEPVVLASSRIDDNISPTESDLTLPQYQSKITEDLLSDILEMKDFPSKLIHSTFDSMGEKKGDDDSFKRANSEASERNSMVSSASVGSRLTFGTSTDEGIGSIYSETYSNIWSSSASSDAGTCSTISVDNANVDSATDEGMSVYSCASLTSSYSSSFSSISQCYSKGALPKSRSMSFRYRPEPKKTSGSSCCLDPSQGVCSLCKDSEEDGGYFKRSVSLRAPKQLPVTPTLLRLLQLGLEQVGGVGQSSSALSCDVNAAPADGISGITRREKPHPPRTDLHRLSRANLEESGDLELDAILSELCELETKFDSEISAPSEPPSDKTENQGSGAPAAPSRLPSTMHPTDLDKVEADVARLKLESRNGSRTSTVSKPKLESLAPEVENGNGPTLVSRTDSPDNDSAFSDDVSLLSSGSSASSGASAGHVANRQQHAVNPAKQHPVTGTEDVSKAKAEKIRMALEKLKEANVKKLFIKAFGADGSSKSLLVDEKMTVSHVCRTLMDKNHVRIDPKWALVEHMPDLHMERIYEDDEKLVDNLLLWTRDSKNRLLFLDRQDKYDLFARPENYLLYGSSPAGDADEETRNNLIEEYFSSGRGPEVEGPLFLKSEGKKAWKKFYFVLRQSGLYFCPKGKSSRSSKDLVCLATLENNQVYHGVGWKKKYKSPTDWCFAIKFPHLQAKNSKHIKYLCAETPELLKQWVMGVRVAKNGIRLLRNYRALVEDIAQEDLDLLASSRRSFSLASVGASSGATTPSSESQSLDSCLAPSIAPSLPEEDTEDASSSADSSSQDTPVNTLGRCPPWRQDSFMSNSSSSSSGCLSERSASTGTPPVEVGFEADFHQQGTIKRKPSSNPKLPLTSTTRHLVKEADLGSEFGSRSGSLRRSARRNVSEEVSTLRRARTSVQSITDNPPREQEPLAGSSLVIGGVQLETNTCDLAELPPPPPELLQSTLSLNSLPPPPEEVVSYANPVSSDINAKICSLPPPPSPQTLPKISNPVTKYPPSPPATPPKPKLIVSLQPPSSPPIAPKPKLDFSDPIYESKIVPPPVIRTSVPACPPDSLRSLISPSSPVASLPPSRPGGSPTKKVKKITFRDEVQHIPASPSHSPISSPVKAPPVPRRHPSTNLTVPPGKLSAPGCKVTPPKSFLTNLQKVMQKKWQVAQKCRDFDTTPHEVLGFRDALSQTQTEKNVGQWIQEHYGSLYENLAPTSPPAVDSPDGPVVPGPSCSSIPLNVPHQPDPSSPNGFPTSYPGGCPINSTAPINGHYANPSGPINVTLSHDGHYPNPPVPNTCPVNSTKFLNGHSTHPHNQNLSPVNSTLPLNGYSTNTPVPNACQVNLTNPIHGLPAAQPPGFSVYPPDNLIPNGTAGDQSLPRTILEQPRVGGGSLRKRPPPPPPKRAETTHLTSRT